MRHFQRTGVVIAASMILVGLYAVLDGGVARNETSLRLINSSVMTPNGALVHPDHPIAAAGVTQLHARNMVIRLPDDERAWYLYGLTSLSANDADTAITAFTQANRQGFDAYVVHQQLGQAYKLVGNYEAAVQAWETSGNLQPALDWGSALLQANNIAAAQAVLNSLQTHASELYYRHEATYRYGVSWAMAGHWDLALPALEQAYQLNPSNVPTLVDLARALRFTGGDAVRAEQLIAQAHALAPNNVWVATIVADMYTALGEDTAANTWRLRLEALRDQASSGSVR